MIDQGLLGEHDKHGSKPMDCATCHSELGSKVTDSRWRQKYHEGAWRRRRQCLNPECGTRWSTIEISMDHYEYIKARETTGEMESLVKEIVKIVEISLRHRG